MDIFGIRGPDPDPHKNLCGSEILYKSACSTVKKLLENFIRIQIVKDFL